MQRKIVALVIMLLVAFSSLVSAQDMTVVDKTTALEKYYYGSEQTGSLVERIAKLEKDIYGAETKDSLMIKIERLYSYTRENSTSSPSFMTKLNAAEWILSHNVTNEPAKTRLDNIERLLLGNSDSSSFDKRLNNLMKLAYAGGEPDINATMINKDTLVKIKIMTPLSSKTSRVGDSVLLQAADDVYIGGILVIAKGAAGTGKVTKVEQAKNFGRDAKIEVSFDTIQAMDGTMVSIFLGDKAKKETESLAKAAGATVAGMVLLGPIGVVGGAFVHGEDIKIPAGAEMYIQAKADTDVYGLSTAITAK